MQRAGSMVAWRRLAQFAGLALTALVLVPPAHAQQKGAITPPTTTLERIKFAAYAIYVSAEPFAEGLVHVGVLHQFLGGKQHQVAEELALEFVG